MDDLDKAVEKAAGLLHPDNFYSDGSRPYFGLDGALRVLEKELRSTGQWTPENQFWGKILISDNFLYDRDRTKHHQVERSIQDYLDQGPNHPNAIHRSDLVVAIARAVEQGSGRNNLYDWIIEKRRAKPIRLLDREIIFPDYASCLEISENIERDVKEWVFELNTYEDPADLYTYWLNHFAENYPAQLEEFKKNKEYDQQITGRYGQALQASAVLSLARALGPYGEGLVEEGTHNPTRARVAATIAFSRQLSMIAGSDEYLLRVQIKRDPNLGLWLDDIHNHFVMEAMGIMDKYDLQTEELDPENPILYINGKLMCPASEHTH